jgi:hypothetical protein
MNLKPGDEIAIRTADRSKRLAVKAIDQTGAQTTPDWLLVDTANLSGKVVRIPTRRRIVFPLKFGAYPIVRIFNGHLPVKPAGARFLLSLSRCPTISREALLDCCNVLQLCGVGLTIQTALSK